MKRNLAFLKPAAVTAFLLLALLPVRSQGMMLKSLPEALQEMFPDAESFVTATCVPSPEEMERVKNALGGKLSHYTTGTASQQTEFEFHFGLSRGRKTGAAVVDVEPGLWGPVEFIVAIDLRTGKVANLAVLSMTEDRGRPIVQRSFLGQFVGKGPNDPLRIRQDIRAVTGATVSSDAACFAVKKVLALFNELYY
jgi:hypothetical protein